ncbi:MAG: universal stress protein [Acidimicrobiales bacterium]
MAEIPEARRMVVGVDGSAGAAAALRWAVSHTDRFGPVQPVASWQYPWWSLTPLAPGAAALPPPSADFHAEALEVVNRMLEAVGPSDHLDPVTAHGPAGQVLVAAAEKATLLVVGTRGHGAVAAGVIGSVSLYCVNHAPVPVAVVPDDALADDRFHRVVVGLDGSPHSLAAARWAVANTPADTRVELLYCRREGHGLKADPSLGTAASASPEGLVAAAIDVVGAEFPAAGARLGGWSEVGDPRQLLSLAATEADLLVLGARGHEGVAHLLLGSVTTGLIHHPVIPTVVVR